MSSSSEPPPAGTGSGRSSAGCWKPPRGAPPPPPPPPPRAAAATLPGAARAQELDGVGDDLDRLALGAVLRLPLAPLEAAVDRDAAALGQVVGAVLALRAPHLDVEVVRLLDPLAAGLILVATVV